MLLLSLCQAIRILNIETALNLRVADYLLKPVNKVEMGNILEKFSTKSSNQARVSQPFDSDDISEEEFCRYIAGPEIHCGLGLLGEKLSARLTKFSAKSSTLYQIKEEEAMVEKGL